MHFYLAAVPTNQVAAHIGAELMGSVWLRPAEALAQADAGSRLITLPTRANLERLGDCRSVAEALVSARALPVITLPPGLVETSEGLRLRTTGERACAITDYVTAAPARKA